MDNGTVYMIFHGRGAYQPDDWSVRGGMAFGTFAGAKRAIDRDIEKVRKFREVRVVMGTVEDKKVTYFDVSSKGHDWVWRVKEHWIIQETEVLS